MDYNKRIIKFRLTGDELEGFAFLFKKEFLPCTQNPFIDASLRCTLEVVFRSVRNRLLNCGNCAEHPLAFSVSEAVAVYYLLANASDGDEMTYQMNVAIMFLEQLDRFLCVYKSMSDYQVALLENNNF